MSRTRAWTMVGLFLAILLSACQSGGDQSIVGRWEFGDQKFGMAYEFYEDGTGVLIQSINPFHPMAGDINYTYDPETGVLNLSVPGTPNKDVFQVSFDSRNKITIEGILKKPLQFVRKPLPELPAAMRRRIGRASEGKNFDFVDAKKLESGWREDYKAYKFVALTNIVMKVGAETEDWLVTLKIEGEDEPSLFVLTKGDGDWGIWKLTKNE